MPISRRRFLRDTSVGAAGVVFGSRIEGGGISFVGVKPLSIGSELQLLIDDFVIEQQAGLTRVMHQPQKQGVIKEADGRDWERGGVYSGKIVCRDSAGKFHMTYRYYWWDAELQKVPQVGIDKAHWFHETVGYATSDDGIHWSKPDLGRFEAPTRLVPDRAFPFEVPAGFSTHNNFGYPINFAYDLNAFGNISDPEKRFLLQVIEKRSGTDPFAKPLDSQMYYAADWPDVTDPHWKEKLRPISSGALSPRGTGFPTLTGYDHEAGEWFMTSQDRIDRWVKRNGRDVARYATKDLVNWDNGELVLPVPEDESKKPEDWVEYMDLWGHRVGGQQTGAWLGQLWIFHSDRRDPESQAPKLSNVWRKGTTEVRLVMSRDAGKTWQRVVGQEVWLPHHAEDSGYDRLVCCACPVQVEDELRFYYACWNGDHLAFYRDGTPYYSDRMRNSTTAWARLRLDGYVSLDAREDRGSFVTKPLLIEGETLRVNLAAPRGELRVGVEDESGNPIEGFSLAEVLPMTGDGVSLPVEWRNQPGLRKLNGRPIRLRFELKNGSLYSFRVS